MIDIDECQLRKCSFGCENRPGSYKCYCAEGYQLSPTDGSTCQRKKQFADQLLSIKLQLMDLSRFIIQNIISGMLIFDV